jgi:predicted transcriptional regulator
VLRWPGVDRIAIYATAPRKEVIGEAVIEEAIEDDIANAWHLTKKANIQVLAQMPGWHARQLPRHVQGLSI